MRLEEGLVAIADTRISSGNECTLARKLWVYQNNNHAMFLTTSGLRSLSDKSRTYFNDIMAEQEEPFDRIYKAVNAFAEQIRRVAQEDEKFLAQSNLPFNIHVLIGGQFSGDRQHQLYLVYPQGNWIEIREGTPYHVIGSSGYGKPILDRTLVYDTPMKTAIKIGCLAFDSTRISATDVDAPIDVVLYARDTFRMIEKRYSQEDLQGLTTSWQEQIRGAVDKFNVDWIDPLIAQLPSAGRTSGSESEKAESDKSRNAL
ncbi:MAG: peptidase [Deltaproteobacteria bacterium]|nr:peptidase [Deltaproteobacteria bacterium]